MILRALFMPRRRVVRLAGFEPTTPGSASQCSNPLSYKRMLAVSYQRSAARIMLAPAGALLPDSCLLLAFWCRGRDLNPHIRKDTAP